MALEASEVDGVKPPSSTLSSSEVRLPQIQVRGVIVDLSDDNSFESTATVVHRRLPKVGGYELQDEALTPRSFFISFWHVYVS
jgi:hypothetical protein